MKPFPKLAFALVVMLQLLAFGGMIARQEYLLRTGTIVRLKCEPVDPRSFLSGDYVRLNYTISNFSEEEFQRLNPNQETFRKHDTIYVALTAPSTQPYWGAAEVSHDRNRLRARYSVVIRGEIQENWQTRIRYGVEQYFVPQFAGKPIENSIRDDTVEVTVDLAVSASGDSALKRLLIANAEVKFY
jgi:uncharacterized membrane-anchored protein